MIIVSQDKDKIFNFNNLTQVYITTDEEETEYEIRCETVDSLYDTLGAYKTEERAKEVLQEIINAIVYSRKAEEAKSAFGFAFVESNTYYEMPED